MRIKGAVCFDAHQALLYQKRCDKACVLMCAIKRGKTPGFIESITAPLRAGAGSRERPALGRRRASTQPAVPVAAC